MAVPKREDANYTSDLNVHDVHTILGPESCFEGKLVFEGTVRIDGTFKGEIRTNDILVVGQGAHVEAQVDVGSMVINGEVIGDIRAKNAVEIHAPGRLRGNLATPQLMIAKGVVFDGNCKMEDAVKAHSNDAAVKAPPTESGGKIKLLVPNKDKESDPV